MLIGELENAVGKERKVRQGMLRSKLPGWAPGMWSDWGQLGDVWGLLVSHPCKRKGRWLFIHQLFLPLRRARMVGGASTLHKLCTFCTWSLVLCPENPGFSLRKKLLVYIHSVKLKKPEADNQQHLLWRIFFPTLLKSSSHLKTFPSKTVSYAQHRKCYLILLKLFKF